MTQTNDLAQRRARRQAVLAGIGDGVAVLATSAEVVRNRDSHYPYRFDSHFHYLSGFAEPEAVLVLHGQSGRSILFCREKDPEREIWDGRRYGPDAAREAFGFDEAWPIAELDRRMPDLLADQSALHVILGDDPVWDRRVLGWLEAVRAQVRNGVSAPSALHDLRKRLDAMRLVKDASELDVMQKAADISALAHQRAMRATRPGMHEYEIEAELLYEFCRHGARSVAYNSIVAGGANACILHYVDNNARLNDGDLLLIDAGCELAGYASDITRTFPVNGRFDAAQRDVYACVLAAQAAALACVKPGASWPDPHDAAVRVLAQGMLDWGLVQGSLDGVIESGAYKRFYMHRTGHWLGMDVHDVGDYRSGGQWQNLVPGMVLTVEPGCYIQAADDVPPAFRNIGIRIEDDVVVTADGHHVLTAGTPKQIVDIEQLMTGQGG